MLPAVFNLTTMAIVRSIFIGRGRKSAGNVTLRHLRGTTIASERIVSNTSRTALQARQRRDFGAFVEYFASDAALLGRLSQKPDGTRSAYNKLFKAIYRPDPANYHTNAYVFGDLYAQAKSLGKALPYIVHGNAPAALSTIEFAQFQEGFNAVFNFLYYNITKEQIDKMWEADEFKLGRVFYNSAGHITEASAIVKPRRVESGASFPAADAQAVDTVYFGYDGSAFRVQIAVHLTNVSAEAQDVSFIKYASLRGLPIFDLNGFKPNIPWDEIPA